MKVKAKITELEIYPPENTIEKDIEVNGKYGIYHRRITVKNKFPLSRVHILITISNNILFPGNVYMCNNHFKWMGLDTKTLGLVYYEILLKRTFKIPTQIISISRPVAMGSSDQPNPLIPEPIELDFTL
jgi:hypothetical protein